MLILVPLATKIPTPNSELKNPPTQRTEVFKLLAHNIQLPPQ